MTLIESLIQSADLFNQVTIKDTAIAITDTTNYLYYCPGSRLDHRVKAGDVIPRGALVERAMLSKTKQIAVVDEHVFGFPYIGTAIPLFDSKGHTVIGSLFIGENTEEQELIKKMTGVITNDVNDVNTMAQGINSKMTHLNRLQNELSISLLNFDAEIQGIQDFSKVIADIAKQTQMLGINASIESARIGASGRGFSVVAEEIGKLSKRSTESVQSIHIRTSKIQATSSNLTQEMSHLELISTQIQEMLNQVAESVDSINARVQELNSLTQI